MPNAHTAQALRHADDIAGVVLSSAPTTLLEAVRVTAAGGHYVPAPPSALPDRAAPPAARLTPREQELLALDQPGASAAMLAQALGVSPRTIAQYRWRIRAKLAQLED